MAVGIGLSHDGIHAYRLHDPVLHFVFPWVWTPAGAQWLNALVHRTLWDRCGVEHRYVSGVWAVQAANAAVPRLEGRWWRRGMQRMWRGWRG